MTANLRTVLLTAVLFGLSTGAYEFGLPLLLKARHVDLTVMGLIFAAAALVMVAARIYLGGLADRWGRKRLYGLALGVCGAAMCATPAFPGLFLQGVLKTVRETAALTRETLHPIILYEAGREVFLDRIGKFRGIEYLLQAGGTFLAGGLYAVLHARSMADSGIYALVVLLAGGLLLLASMVWIGGFRETHAPVAQKQASVRDLLSFDLHPNLLLIALSGIIFSFGLQLSHSFYMMLFFQDRYGASDNAASVIMVIHRFTLALPLLVVGQLRLKNLRGWYAGGLALQGVVLATSALMPTLLLSAAIWLLHDFIGAGIWLPIQSTLIQRYSREATRGLEVGKVLAWAGLGSIFGPLAAGPLAKIHPSLPFFLSGVLVFISAIPLLWLKLTAPVEAREPVVG